MRLQKRVLARHSWPVEALLEDTDLQLGAASVVKWCARRTPHEVLTMQGSGLKLAPSGLLERSVVGVGGFRRRFCAAGRGNRIGQMAPYSTTTTLSVQSTISVSTVPADRGRNRLDAKQCVKK